MAMKLIAKKPCSFGGERFYIGDEIPVELVQNPATQEKYGILAIMEGDAVTPAPTVNATVVSDPVLTITVSVNGEQMDLEPTDDGLQDIFNVLIADPDSAIATVNKMTDNDALILLHLSERRTTVKKAAKARAEKLRELTEEPRELTEEPQESAGEQ